MQRIIEGTAIGVTKGILPTWLVRSLDQTGFGHIRNLSLAAREDLESFGHQALAAQSLSTFHHKSCKPLQS